jgi:hypothetical protein
VCKLRAALSREASQWRKRVAGANRSDWSDRFARAWDDRFGWHRLGQPSAGAETFQRKHDRSDSPARNQPLINDPTHCYGWPTRGGSHFMSIVDDLVSNIVERNALRLNGTFTIALVEGGLSLKGTVLSTLRDQKKGKDILSIKAPIDAEVRVGEIVVPLPHIQ